MPSETDVGGVRGHPGPLIQIKRRKVKNNRDEQTSKVAPRLDSTE